MTLNVTWRAAPRDQSQLNPVDLQTMWDIDINLPYNFTLRDYQIPLWDTVMDPEFLRGVVVIPRRNGKDLVCFNLEIAKAMQKPNLYFYIAPYYNQVRQIIWEGITNDGRRFLDYIPGEIIESKTKLDMRIELINGSQIKLCGSDNIDSIMGTNPYGVVFTEFSLHKPEAWEYIRPILADNGGWALFNGTPRGLNHFYLLYQAALQDPAWFTMHLTRDDTGHPTLDAIAADRRSGMPESLIEQEYYCSWTSSQEETLIPLDTIQPAINRKVDEDAVRSHPRIIGADVAYAEKGDKAVIAKRQGPMALPLKKFQGLDNMGFATHISRDIRDWGADYIFVDAGRGEGVISRLHQLGHDNVIPVHFGGKTFSDLYNRRKDELWCRAKEWFTNEVHPASIPDDEELISELSTPLFVVNERGFIQIESKVQLKKRGFRSTDCADAFVLTFAEDVDSVVHVPDRLARQGVDERMYAQMQEQQQNTYDMMNYMDTLQRQADQHNHMNDPYGDLQWRYKG